MGALTSCRKWGKDEEISFCPYNRDNVPGRTERRSPMKKDTTNDLAALMEGLTRTLEEVCEDALDLAEQEGTELRDLERATRAAMNQVGMRFLELLIEACRPAKREETVRCRCGAEAEFERYRDGTVITTFDQIAFKRAYYLCPECHQGTYPLDERLRLRAGGFSGALQETLALLGIHLPFEMASDLIERLIQVSVSDNGVRESTERMGQERLEEEEARVEAAWDLARFELPDGPEDPPQRLYGSIDGTTVRTEEGWREAKLGSWYRTDKPPEREPWEDWNLHAEAIEYYGDIMEAEDFGRLVYLTGRERGAHRAEELVFIADGARWIWNVVEEHFPDAVQIVDWYHATEYIWKVAHAAYGEGSEMAQEWAAARMDELWHGDFDDVLRAFRDHVTLEWGDDPARQAVNYFQNNRHRMCYPAYRDQGYQIGSGTIESGCKRVIGARLKQAGMTWTVRGARQMIKARALHLSGQWDDFCNHRAPPRRTYSRCVA
jgi:hypothetical protein